MTKPPGDQRLNRARRILTEARSVFVLTGAGISAESGIPTFRGCGGIWQGLRVEDFATPEGFQRDPERVWRWYNERRVQLGDVRPNAAHRALAELQRRVRNADGRFVLATQNIDGLHQAAGSQEVLELHGSLKEIRCTACEHHAFVGFESIEQLPSCPKCGRHMRPAVVWFGEALPQDVLEAGIDAASRCDLMLSVGTSAIVYPAAGLIEYAIGTGARVIEVNLEPTPASALADVALHGRAGEILPELLGRPPNGGPPG